MHLEQAKSDLIAFLQADIPTMLWGAPGVGKSDGVRQTAATLYGGSMIDFRASTRDPVAIMGLPALEGETTKWKVPDEFPRVDRDGPEGILFLDEINAASPSMQAAMFGLVLDRRVGDYVLPDGWRIVAAGNRQSDRAAAQRMPSALANRFAHIDVEPNVDAFCTWALKNLNSPEVYAFIRFRDELLHKMPEGDADPRTFPTPRAWASVARVANSPMDVLGRRVTALVGEAAAAEFVSFIDIYRSLPSIDSVIANPTGSPVPSDKPAAMFALAGGLARKVDSSNFANAMVYAKRLGREFEIMFAIDATHRDPGLTHTATFTQWAQDNADVTNNAAEFN